MLQHVLDKIVSNLLITKTYLAKACNCLAVTTLTSPLHKQQAFLATIGYQLLEKLIQSLKNDCVKSERVSHESLGKSKASYQECGGFKFRFSLMLQHVLDKIVSNLLITKTYLAKACNCLAVTTLTTPELCLNIIALSYFIVTQSER